jgi:hypothetical protein
MIASLLLGTQEIYFWLRFLSRIFKQKFLLYTAESF